MSAYCMQGRLYVLWLQTSSLISKLAVKVDKEKILVEVHDVIVLKADLCCDMSKWPDKSEVLDEYVAGDGLACCVPSVW